MSVTLKTAERLEQQAGEKLRDRETNTPKKLCQARSAEREGRQMQRAARLIRAYCDLSPAGLPESLRGRKLSKSDFLTTAAKTSVMCPNGYHAYSVDSDEWRGNDRWQKDLRALAGMEEQFTPEDQRQALLQQKIDALRNTDIPGFFPTPDPVIDRMIEQVSGTLARSRTPIRMLEPSAGIGSICDRMRVHFPLLKIDVAELRPSLREILELKGYNLIGENFLALPIPPLDKRYDVVLMNPPFEEQAYTKHILWAWDFLKPGGILVALAAPGFLYRQDRVAREFREWSLANLTATDLPPNSFTGIQAFRKTGVQVVMLTGER